MYQSKNTPQSEKDWHIEDKILPTYFGVGWTKIYSELMCEFYAGLGKCKYTAIRHSNTYGAYDQFDLNKCHVLAAFIKKINEATNTLEIWGDGKAARDLLYIDDLIHMITLCIQKQETQYELFNCGIGKAYNVVDIAKRIMTLMKKDLIITFNQSKPNIPTTVILHCDKAHKELGWYPQIDLNTGLIKTIDWYQKR